MKRSVAVAVSRPGPPNRPADASGPADPPAGGAPRRDRAWLLVRRPPNDEDLPGVWGLPAASFRPGESLADVVRRIGADKLGVELRPGPAVAEGALDRAGHRLRMTLCAAELVSGAPAVPRSVGGVTQYVDWGWRSLAALEPGAEAGSLCCSLALEWAASPEGR